VLSYCYYWTECPR